MTKKSFHIQTFGCQMNEHDSETLAGMLEGLGYVENKNNKEADIAIINTCSVRENADKRFFGTLGQLKKVKEDQPEVVVAVCGCMMQQQHIIDTLKAKYPWVDLIFGTHNLHEFPRLLANVLNERNKVVDVWEDGGDIVEGLPVKRNTHSRRLSTLCTAAIIFVPIALFPTQEDANEAGVRKKLSMR